jgi:hypothetical protein
VSKSHYPYPPDEFDVRGPEGAPVGVHREPRSGWSSVWPFLLVIVACGVIAVGVVSFLSKDGGPGTQPVAEQSAGAGVDDGADGDEDAGDSEEPSDDASEPDGEGSDEPEGEQSDEPEGEESDESAPDVAALVSAADTSAFVRVLNDDSGINGEAGRGAAALEAQGFSSVEAADFPQDSGQSANVVWYVPGREDTAAAVAAILGVPAERTSEQQLGSGDVIVVVKGELTIAE